MKNWLRLVVSTLASSVSLQAVDLSPYAGFLLKDGAQLTYSVEVDQVLREGRELSYTYGIEAEATGAGLYQSVLHVSLSDNTGLLLSTATSSYEVRSDGVYFMGDSYADSQKSEEGTLLSGEGLFLPKEASFGSEFTWSYVIEYAQLGLFGPTTYQKSVSGVTKVEGLETVSTPYGVFPDTLKVIYTETSGSKKSTATFWFDQDVGPVKMIYTDTDAETPGVSNSLTMELIAFKEGSSVGSGNSPADLISVGSEIINGVAYQDWLGFFSVEDTISGLTYHFGFGYMLPLQADPTGGLWIFLYRDGLDLVYVRPGFLIPQFNENSNLSGNLAGWLYVLDGNSGEWLWIYSTFDGRLFVWDWSSGEYLQI